MYAIRSYYGKAGHWEKARECYQGGIEVDNLAEEFYQSLMSCYLAVAEDVGAFVARCAGDVAAADTPAPVRVPRNNFV